MTSLFFKYLLISLLPAFLLACNSESHSDSHDIHDESEEHHHPGTFEMDAGQIEKFGIRFEKITPAPFAEVVKVTGFLEPSPFGSKTVTARKSGIFSLSPGITVGSTVKTGAVLGTISPEGIQGGDLQAAAKANLDGAKKEYERLKPLFEEGLVTVSQLNEAETRYNEARALVSSSVGSGPVSVVAPSAGVLSAINVSSGQFVEAGAPVAIVSENAGYSLRADLPSRLAPKVGDFISANFRPEHSDSVFSVTQLGGKKISGNTIASNSLGYFPIYFTLNGNPLNLSGGFAEVFLVGASRDSVLTVPRDAIIEIQGNKYLYVVHDGHSFEKRLVKTGSTDGFRIEITGGIAPGEEIVSTEATIVRMAETSSVAPPSHTHNH